MFNRLVKFPESSFFLFGPRGTGKSYWLREQFTNAVYLDLLDPAKYLELSMYPNKLSTFIPANFKDWIIVDEVQKIPILLDEIHRLMETKKYKFIITGSSARKLRRHTSNLLAGRALTRFMHPLTISELKKDFNLAKALKWGMLPSIYDHEKKNIFADDYLKSYIQTYLREEVQSEGLTRNMGSFGRFLETASFSQGDLLNISGVARDAQINRKVVENYFQILEDLLIGYRLPVFNKRAKRQVANHPKFYFFDVGIFRMLRPHGPLDYKELIDGPALETLFLQEIRSYLEYFQREFDYKIYYWRTSKTNIEVDFILYGNSGLIAIEIKRNSKIRPNDLSGLKAFKEDYKDAKLYLFYGGSERRYLEKEIEAIPIEAALISLPQILGKK